MSRRKIQVFKDNVEEYFQGASPSDSSASELTSALAEVNGFDLSYLQENSRGSLATGQLSLLLSPLLVGLLFALIPGGFLVYQMYQQGFIKKLSSGMSMAGVFSEMPSGLLIMGAILLAVSLLGLYFLVMTILDMVSMAVASIEGQGMRRMTTSTDDDGTSTTRTYYVIDGQRFSVKNRAFRTFENGRTYRAYFTPRRKILVNIEALD
jgi:hypothetical protein